MAQTFRFETVEPLLEEGWPYARADYEHFRIAGHEIPHTDQDLTVIVRQGRIEVGSSVEIDVIKVPIVRPGGLTNSDN